MGGIEAIGDAIFHRPEDGFIEEVRLLHIGEGILVGGGVRENRQDKRSPPPPEKPYLILMIETFPFFQGYYS